MPDSIFQPVDAKATSLFRPVGLPEDDFDEIAAFRVKHPTFTQKMTDGMVRTAMQQQTQFPDVDFERSALLRAQASSSDSFWRFRHPFSPEAIASTTDPLNPLSLVPIKGIQEATSAPVQGGERAYTEAMSNVLNAFGALFDLYSPHGTPSVVGDAVRGWADSYESAVGTSDFEGEFLYDAGRFTADLVPSALSLIVSGGASAPVLAYFGIQGFGGGVREYREAMEAHGATPDQVNQIAIGVGYGSVEVVTELLGLELIGRFAAKKAFAIGDAMLRGNYRGAAKVVSTVATGAPINGIEETLAQFGHNAIAGISFDPNRRITEGGGQAFLLGSIGGAGLTTAGLFSSQARQAYTEGTLNAERDMEARQIGIQQDEFNQSLRDVALLAGVDPDSQTTRDAEDAEVRAAVQSTLASETATEFDKRVAQAVLDDLNDGIRADEGVVDAAQEGQVQEGDISQRQDVDQGREAEEAGRSDRVKQGQEGQEVSQQDKTEFIESAVQPAEGQEVTFREAERERRTQESVELESAEPEALAERADRAFALLNSIDLPQNLPKGARRNTIGGRRVRAAPGTIGLSPEFRTQAEAALESALDDNGVFDENLFAQLPADQQLAIIDAVEDAVLGHIEARSQDLRNREIIQNRVVRTIAKEITANREGRTERNRGLSALVTGEGNYDLDLLVDVLGQGDRSITHKALYDVILEARRAQNTGFVEGLDFLIEVIENSGIGYGSNQMISMSETLSRSEGAIDFIRFLLTDRPVTQTVKGLRPKAKRRPAGVEGLEFTGTEFISFWMQMQDADTRQQVVGGEGIRTPGMSEPRSLTDAEIDTILASVSPAERQIGDALVGYINGPLRQQMQEWSLEVLGFDITTEGIYVPRRRDKQRDDQVSLTEVGEELFGLMTRSGITRERTGGTSAVIIGDAWVEFQRYVWLANSVIHETEALQNANRILNSSTINQAARTAGVEKRVLTNVKTMLSDHANQAYLGGKRDLSTFDRFLLPILNRINVGLLQIKAAVPLFQFGSYGGATTEIPLRIAIRAWLTGPLEARRANKRMREKSAVLRLRQDGAAAARTSEGFGGQLSGQVAGIDVFGQELLAPIRWADTATVTRIWIAAEMAVAEQERLLGPMTQAEKDRRTVELAERIVNRTQPTFGDSLSLTQFGVESRDRAAQRMLFMFRSALSKQLSALNRAAIHFGRQKFLSPSEKREALRRLLTTIFFFWMGNALWVGTTREAVQRTRKRVQTGEWPEGNFFEGVIREMLNAGAAVVPVMGNAISGGVQKLINLGTETDERVYDPDFSPFFSIFEEMLFDFPLMFGNENAENTMDDFVRWTSAVMTYNGLPGSSLEQAYKSVKPLIFED